jgi:hypothetical protein
MLLRAFALESVLRGLTRSTVCSVTYFVDESKSRTVGGKKVLQKLVTISHVYLNHNYQNKVNNLNGTNDFVAEPLKGKTRVCSTLLSSDRDGKMMLDGKVLNKESITETIYFHNGQQISKDVAIMNDYFAPNFFKAKTTMGRGSVSADNDFGIINPKLDAIRKIKLEKVEMIMG